MNIISYNTPGKVNRLVLILFPVIMIMMYMPVFAGNDHTMIVTADSGLNIRVDHDVKSSALGIVPFGERVSVSGEEPVADVVGGIQGRWVRVRWRNLQGWVFNHYLSDAVDDATELRHMVFLEKTNSSNVDTNFIFKADTLRVEKSSDGYHIVSFDFTVPHGDPTDLREYDVWKKANGKWTVKYSCDSYTNGGVLLRDINGDGKPDLVVLAGGYGVGPFLVKVFINEHDFFSDKALRRLPELEYDFEKYDISNDSFRYTGPGKGSMISGSIRNMKTGAVTRYEYHYDSAKKCFIKGK